MAFTSEIAQKENFTYGVGRIIIDLDAIRISSPGFILRNNWHEVQIPL